MGMLAQHTDHFDNVTKTVKAALLHFDNRLGDQDAAMLRKASDYAFSDEILFEKFLFWQNEKDDEAFMYHIRRFLDNHGKAALPDRNQTHRRHHIETEIKVAARESLKKSFSKRLTSLSLKFGLDSNAKIGAFLSVSEEQARKFRSGEHKPQLATIRAIAEKFGVSPEYLSGIADDV